MRPAIRLLLLVLVSLAVTSRGLAQTRVPDLSTATIEDLMRIEITSAVDEKAQRFKLTWTEKGGPPVQEPTRRSFGTRLIDRLADQLHGDVRLKYEPAGVVCELDVPLAALRTIGAN